MPSHQCSRTLLILIAVLTLMTACGSSESPPPMEELGNRDSDHRLARVDPKIDTLVTAEWLSRHLDDPDLVVLECTVTVAFDENGAFVVTNGRAGYEDGHIPTAGFADLMGDLSDGDSPLSFAMPTPEQFCAAMGALGVGDDSRVVLYDEKNQGWAARVWWMLRWVGFDRAALLDGGLEAWTDEDRPMSFEPVDRPARTLTPTLRPELIADRDEVFAAIEDDAVTLIDVMYEAHYRGEMSLYDRPGHIPGALSIPSLALLDGSTRYRPHDELVTMHDGDHNARAIIYCGSGIAASSNAFVMTRLGYSDVAVYMASLQEWAADPANPLVVDTP